MIITNNMLHPYAFNGKNNYFSPGKNIYGSGPINQLKNSKQTISFKGFNAPISLPNNYFDECWLKLNQAIETIVNNSQPPEGLQNLYQLCQILCRNKHGEKIYNRLEQVFETSSREKLENVTRDSNSHDFLSKFNQEWKSYQQQSKILNIIFSYLDQTQVRKTSHFMPLSKLSLHKFKEALQDNSVCRDKIYQSLILVIFQHKGGKSFESEAVKNLLEMLIHLNIYQDTFEKELLFHTEQFYRAQSKEKLSSLTLKQYIHYVEVVLEQEKEFISSYLHGQTEKSIIDILFSELIKHHGSDIVLNSGFNSLLENYDHDLMKQLYSLYKHVGILDILQNALCESITYHSTAIIQTIPNDPQAIHKLIWLNNISMKYLSQAMEHNPVIYDAIKKCIGKTLRTQSVTIAQKLSSYLNQFLINPEIISSDLLPDQVIENGIQLFRLNESKDMFENLYHHQLANRLLNDENTQLELEQKMVDHLREVSNLDFTNNLEGMLRDIHISQDLTNDFRPCHESKLSQDFQTEFKVLSSYHWPTSTITDFHLPTQLLDLQNQFDQFYSQKYPDKKLSWPHHLARCQIQANFPTGSKQFTTNCFQASILTLFDQLDQDELSYSTISQHTGIPSKELNQSLDSLSYGPYSILLKQNSLDSSLESCVFRINDQFTHPSHHINIYDLNDQKETPVESEIKHKTFIDRQYQVDSALTRIMKNINKCSISELEMELDKVLPYTISNDQFDERIHYLVDKGYLEFLNDDTSTIAYIP